MSAPNPRTANALAWLRALFAQTLDRVTRAVDMLAGPQRAVENSRDFSILADHERQPRRDPQHVAQQRCCAVATRQRALRIRHERKRDLVLARKTVMGRGIVDRNADHLGVAGAELGVVVAEAARFAGANGGEITRVKIEDQVLFGQNAGERKSHILAAAAGRDFEIGGLVANLQAHLGRDYWARSPPTEVGFCGPSDFPGRQRASGVNEPERWGI